MKTIAEPLQTSTEKILSSEKKMGHIVRLGYLFLLTSFFLFGLYDYVNPNNRENSFAVFVLHYLIAVTYAIVLMVHGAYGIRKCWREENMDTTIILLNLFLVSAYALNRQIPVFAESTTWLSSYLVVTSVVMLSFRYFDALPVWVNRLQHMTLGSVALLYLYLAIYVANVYGIGFIGILFFGIGAHVFVPLLMFTGCFFLIRHTTAEQPRFRYWAAGGAVASITIVLLFMGEWNTRLAKMQAMSNQSVLHENTGLPIWVEVAQRIKKDWISEKIIKSDLVYTTHNKNFQWGIFPTDRMWNEKKKHDPLVFLSSLISKCALSYDDRVKILQSVFADRHHASERLWSGDNLTTSYIVSDVDIYPALRLAYMEKYLNVRNNINNDSWRGATQEAIYTFQLPEGSVVTSLSLWINGKEEKGILTSKQKADNAYKTIVGVEQRDPSVVHWQEGNTVSVRVFPCTPEEDRKFKIGITCPLIERNDQVIFRNITFLGPSATRANETFRVRLIGNHDDIVLPGNFKKDSKGDFIAEQPYDPDFELVIKKLPVPTNQFTFAGYSYSMEPYTPAFEKIKFDKIVLDINNSWTANELEAAESFLLAYKVYTVANNELIQLTADNWANIIDDLKEHHFSIFPFHKIAPNSKSLIITKGKGLSPHLSDFKDTEFSKQVGAYFTTTNRARVFNLEGGISTYVGSLRELRGITFAQGNVTQLTDWLNAEEFPVTQESDEKVILHDAKVAITKTEISGVNPVSNNAPDHLARLFAYNNIMRQIGVHYFEKDFLSKALVEEATSAYVVSPVSSLIVLETQNDYDRFGIEDSANSLHNASKASVGAVPEPHEWALIILFLGFVLCLKVRRQKLRTA